MTCFDESKLLKIGKGDLEWMLDEAAHRQPKSLETGVDAVKSLGQSRKVLFAAANQTFVHAIVDSNDDFNELDTLSAAHGVLQLADRVAATIVV